MSDLTVLTDALKGPLGDLIRQVAGPLAGEVGESLGVVARHYRYRLAVKMWQKTERMLRDAGITAKAVPPRLFLPISESASVEDDEDVHTRWAALLANAATSENSVHPSFIEILRELTPEDAQLLDRLYDSCESKRTRRVTPWVYPITYAERKRREAAGENPIEPFQNLVRLGLVETEYTVDKQAGKVKVVRSKATVDPPKLKSHTEVTKFALRFVQACRAPKKPTSDT